MEALTTGALSIKQNIHLVKNVMLPIELIPVRSVIVGMASQFVSIGARPAARCRDRIAQLARRSGCRSSSCCR